MIIVEEVSGNILMENQGELTNQFVKNKDG